MTPRNLAHFFFLDPTSPIVSDSNDDCLSASLTIKVEEFVHITNHLLLMHPDSCWKVVDVVPRHMVKCVGHLDVSLHFAVLSISVPLPIRIPQQ